MECKQLTRLPAENAPGPFRKTGRHAGMVPNLRPNAEKGLEEDDWDGDWEEDSEDSPALNPEASKVEPDLSPITEAEINQMPRLRGD